MSTKKSNKSRKDPMKTPKVWERARREKMKIYFNELQEVLPFYDPSAPMSRFEILQKSRIYIKDLQNENQDLLNGGFDEVYKLKMMKLKERVKELLKRVDQLTDLLRMANIMIPPLESYSEGSKTQSSYKWMSQHPKKWTEKINLVVPDDKIKSVLTLIKDYKKNSNKVKLKKKQLAKNFEKSEITVTSEPLAEKTLMQKKKKVLKKSSKVISLKSSKSEKKDEFPRSQSPSQFKENQPVDFNLISNNTNKSSNILEHIVSESSDMGKSLNSTSTTQTSKPQESSLSKIAIPQNVILPSVPNVLQPNTFILTNNGALVQLPVLNSQGAVLNSNSNLLAPTAVIKPSTDLLTSLVINKPSPVIVLQKPSPQTFQTAQIISAPPQVIVSKPNVQIIGTTNVYTAATTMTSSKILPHILSKTPANKKRITRDSTVTTFVNKIPIPALSKQSYTKKSVPLNLLKKEAGIIKAKKAVEKSLENPKEKVIESNCTKGSTGENAEYQNEKLSAETVDKKKEENTKPESNSDCTEKRNLREEKTEGNKKQKLDESLLSNADENVFKPIESDTSEVFCNLALPNSLNPSLSVSPTAAFLSSFPIVAPTRSEDDVPEKKSDEEKNPKVNEEQPVVEKNKENNDTLKEGTVAEVTKNSTKESSCTQAQAQVAKGKTTAASNEPVKFLTNTNITCNSVNNNTTKNSLDHQQLAQCKSWEQFHQEASESFYMPSDNSSQVNNPGSSVGTINLPIVSYSHDSTAYKNYSQNTNVKATGINLENNVNQEMTLETNHFDYLQKDNYMSKVPSYNNETPLPVKQCSNNDNMSESYTLSKSQPNYQIDLAPNYQLISSKEVSNQRNSRTVNWMTEPDVSNRPPVYGSQTDKMIARKISSFGQSDNFYVNTQNSKVTNDCSGHFIINDQNKTNYQKNDFYGKDQRCKTMEKRADDKCYIKTSQNSYNLFDYNYSQNCYGDENANKYCQNQSYSGKIKKGVTQPKKKSDVHQVNELPAEPAKRVPDQTISNMDFNSVANQECFTWVPGKNVDWLPSKSFGLDTNLVVPSTLPTLVGDLALGTTSTSDLNQKNVNTKAYQSNLKSNLPDVNKDYIDISMGNSSKLIETVDANKQYFEPFANLSKNIFDVTNTNISNPQIPKNDYEKINFMGSGSNETIVIKNIFELPVSKSSGSDFSRNKQRTINSSQNTFLSVSQLVEPSGFEGNAIKNDNQEPPSKVDPYTQNYPNYSNQKPYKNKTRNSHCKFNDRKYHGYKNGSSSYTAEALLRSNTNVIYQSNEFSTDVSSNFFNAKSSQKSEQFHTSNKIDFEINMKSDFSASAGQNIYSDFNFSSPVPNFGIGPTVGTDFGNHDSSGNFSTQNNSFFGDYITPEYPLSENVSNSLLLPQCSIALQNPFVIDKRSAPAEKNKNNSKQYSGSRNRKHYDCTKTSFNEFPIHPTSAILTTSSITCPTIFTTSACQNLLPVPTQSIPISFSSPSFTTSNIAFPPLSSTTNSNYHRFPNTSHSQNSENFLTSNTMLTTCTSKPLSSQNCYSSSNSFTNVTNSVISSSSSSFSVGNAPLTSVPQTSIAFFSLSNPIIPSSAPTSSSNSLANFNLSTIFPEINQKGNYQYS